MNITTFELVNSIWAEFGTNEGRKEVLNLRSDMIGDSDMCLLRYGRMRGWLEEQDELYCQMPIDRRGAARIIHCFLKTEYGHRDTRDWSNAKKLKDLYDCRICTNHIAQVVEWKILPPEEATRFNLTGRISEEELGKILEQINRRI